MLTSAARPSPRHVGIEKDVDRARAVPSADRGARDTIDLNPTSPRHRSCRTSAVDDSTQASPTPSFFDVNKYRAEPGNPGAIRIPGTNVAIYIGGFAQLDVISDINVIGNQDQFVVSSIPVGAATGNTGFELSARQSRVFIETDAPWSVAPLMAYIEVDFFDPQNQTDPPHPSCVRRDRPAQRPAPDRRAYLDVVHGRDRDPESARLRRSGRHRQRAAGPGAAHRSVQPQRTTRTGCRPGSRRCSRSRRPTPRSRCR